MRVNINDVCYNLERAGHGVPVLLLHGFTGSAASRHAHQQELEKDFDTLAIDFLGHGNSDSPTDTARYSMEWTLCDLEAILDRLEIARANVLGYSMGGRVALQFAHAHPERVSALILESASPGIADAAERAQRAASDMQLAETIERDGLETFVEYWTNLPLFASQARLPDAARARLKSRRLQNNPAGLANSLRGLSVGKQTSLWQQLKNIETRTLLIAGAFDQKYTTLAHRMGSALANARAEIVPNAGHAVHLEQPELFSHLVYNFLSGTGD